MKKFKDDRLCRLSGHDLTEWYQTVTEAAGTMQARYCRRCGHSEKKHTPAAEIVRPHYEGMGR